MQFEHIEVGTIVITDCWATYIYIYIPLDLITIVLIIAYILWIRLHYKKHRQLQICIFFYRRNMRARFFTSI
jgi:hypothetical protein